ncbi:MAG: tetratricopeptide repeat protein [candidate division Zixibacteria bacterium]|nr:tetratricopeptide repeat protein [candidate division Zixibacteria bacterium]
MPILTLAFLAIVRPVVHADQFAKHNNTANDLARKGDYNQALDEYQAARVERPTSPEVIYNIGNVYHERGDYDTAAVEYQNALSHLSGPLLPDAYYNLGNTLYRKRDMQAAIAAYKRSLIENPGDLDAKHNLELATRFLQMKDSSQKDQPKQQDKNHPDSSQQNQQNQKKQSSDSTQNQQNTQQQDKDQPENDSSSASNPKDQQKDRPDQQHQKPRPMKGMTKEDAARLLDALKNDELALQRRRAMRIVENAKVTKDW